MCVTLFNYYSSLLLMSVETKLSASHFYSGSGYSAEGVQILEQTSLQGIIQYEKDWIKFGCGGLDLGSSKLLLPQLNHK